MLRNSPNLFWFEQRRKYCKFWTTYFCFGRPWLKFHGAVEVFDENSGTGTWNCVLNFSGRKRKSGNLLIWRGKQLPQNFFKKIKIARRIVFSCKTEGSLVSVSFSWNSTAPFSVASSPKFQTSPRQRRRWVPIFCRASPDKRQWLRLWPSNSFVWFCLL